MQLVMMGTGPFAVPTFRALYTTSHDVVALVTQPARKTHGRRKAPTNPMRLIAQEHDTVIFAADDINEEAARKELAAFDADLYVVADYGQILSAQTLSTSRLGAVNLHASLLPEYRGAAPINWALYDGRTETGVTIFQLTPRIDAGPTLSVARVAIDPDEDVMGLEARMAELGAPLMVDVVDRLSSGTAEPVSQDSRQATPARRLRKSDGLVDWNRTAKEIKNQIRAMSPWPKTYTYWRRTDGEPLRLILGSVKVLPGEDLATSPAVPHRSVEPGTVIKAADNELLLATGGDVLAIESLQPAGKRLLSADEFLRGYPVAEGDKFGPES